MSVRVWLAQWAAQAGYWAVLATIVVAPTQWDILNIQGGRGCHISLVDPLLGFAFLCWVVRVLARGSWWRMPWPWPWPVLAFVLPALLSLVMVERGGAGEALRETAKLVAYFGVGYLLYDDLLRNQAQRLRIVLGLLLAVTVAMVLLALVQFFIYTDPVRGVSGAFESRNVLGGWLALMLPMAAAVALHAERLLVRVGLWLLVVVGLLVDLTAASVGAVLCVVALLAAVRGARAFVVFTLGATLWLGVLSAHMGGFLQPETSARLTSQQVLFQSVALYQDGQPERRYPQWQSALEMMLSNPWLGVGIGNYQRRVEQYTGAKPMPTGPSEPCIQNLYLVIGSTMGVPALLGFLALLLLPAFGAGAVARRHAGWRRGVVYGVTGGLAAFAVTAIWHPLLVRGIGLHLVLLLVMARLLAEWSAGKVRG
jgi:O-antigen ligase